TTFSLKGHVTDPLSSIAASESEAPHATHSLERLIDCDALRLPSDRPLRRDRYRIRVSVTVKTQEPGLLSAALARACTRRSGGRAPLTISALNGRPEEAHCLLLRWSRSLAV